MKQKKIMLERGVIQDGASSEAPDDIFDYVVMRHVLEHIQDLDAFMSHLVKRIKHEGYMFVEVPDWGQLDRFTDPYIFEHVWQFNTYSLIKLMKRAGLVVVSLQTEVLPYSRSTSNRVIRCLAKKVDVPGLGSDSFIKSVEKHDSLLKSEFTAMNNFLHTLDKDTKIAITPASHYTFEFLSNTELKNYNVIGLFDNDEKKKSLKVNGFTVELSKDMSSKSPDVILVLTIGAYKDEMVSQFKQMFPGKKVLSQSEIIEVYGE